jgi:protein involved in polysaccharide export with SLBB domain
VGLLAQVGSSTKLTEEQAKAKLKELGISEEEARRKAKEKGLNLEDYVQLVPDSTTQKGIKIEVSRPGAPPVEVKIPAAEPTPSVTEPVPSAELAPPTAEKIPVARDVAPSPKGLQGLDYFGYDIFKQLPAAFEPTAVGPVDPGYLLGASDVLRLTVWGQAEFQYELQVDREGRVFIPNVGQVFVLGTPLNKLEQKLKNQLSKFYSGLADSPPTVFMDVTITKLRPLRIFVMGEVKQPGGYTISSYATVFNALYSVGGPLTRGSLRGLRVLRENKVVATVDLYDYLLRGDQSSDVRLQNNDIVFVPPRGKTVSIRGEVLRAAIYELKENEHLGDLINYAGGLLATAYLENAQIDRIKPFEARTKGTEDRIVVDVALRNVLDKSAGDVALFDADEVQIFSILTEKKNYVTLGGAVWRPGRYELGKILTIKDLVAAAEGTKPETFFGKADLERRRPDLTREFITFNLSKALEGDPQGNIVLQPWDVVRLYSIHELEFEKTLTISGHVKFPQTIPYADSITLRDLVFRAGGLLDPEYQKLAYLERADLVRMNPDMITKRIIPFNLQRLLEDSTYNIRLEPRDEVIVYGIGVTEIMDKYVTIDGNVKSPGKYSLRSNMTLSDLALLAGGYTEDAYFLQAEVSRLSPDGYRGDTVAVIIYPKLSKDFSQGVAAGNPSRIDGDNHSREGEFLLRQRDYVSVRPNPEYKEQCIVYVEGDFTYTGAYAIRKKAERISEILARAGGPTKTSYLGGAQYLRGGTRLIVDLDRAYRKKDLDHDVTVLAGDRIVIPSKPNTVLVVGEVNNPGLLSFLSGDDVSDYIERAGGLTDSANYAILTMSTGESRKVDFGWFRSDPDVPDGSQISVLRTPPSPLEGDKVDWSGTIKDSFAVLTSAATIAFIVWQVTK